MQTLEQNQQKVYIQLMPKDKDNRYSRPAKAGLYNKSLTLAEKGLISIMVGMNPYEPITIAKLSTKCAEYDDTLRSYLNSLESKGLVTKELVKKKGAIKEYHYSLNEFHVANLTDRTFTDRLKAKKKQTQNKTIQDLDTISSVAKSYDRKVTTRETSETFDTKEFPEFSKNIYINNKNNYYYKNNNNTFEDEENNVENCVIQISNIKKEKEDLEKIQIIKDYLVNITSVDLPFTLKDIENLQKQASKFYNGGKSIQEIKIMIDLFPEFVKANKISNPKRSFSENESLSFLANALKENYNYPEWFNNFQKNKVIETKKDEWKEFIKIWDKFSVASTQRDSLNLIISHFMTFIIESKKPESKYYNGLKNYTKDSLRKSLKIKSLDEIIEMIDSQIKEQNGASTTFKKDTKDFFLNGFTIDSIKDLFKSIEV